MKTSWDLTPLFKSDNDPEIAKVRKKVESESYKFINKWTKKDDYLKSPQALKEALDDYNARITSWGEGAREWYYFAQRFSLNQIDPKIKARLNQVQDFGKKIENDIQFFALRLAKVDRKTQEKFLKYKPLLPYKHFLERLFIEAEHLLSEPEEKIMNLKSAPSYSNWVNMVSGFLAKEEREVLSVKGKPTKKNFSEILGLINNKDQKVRDTSAKALNAIFANYVDVAENEINSVFQNKKINDELRKFTRPDTARHIGDDIETEVVDTLIKAVTLRFDIPKSFYKLKAKLFRFKKLKYHERNVDYGKVDKKYSFDKAIEIIGKVYKNLDQEFLDIFNKFINEGRVDVYPKKGKTSGAFARYNLISQPTYILINYTDRLNDVLTLAHELGHGINYEFIKQKQNALNFGTTVATAEVASTFMEDFVLQELTKTGDDELKLALLMMKLNEDISTIFRQVAFYNFEHELHKTFREKGYVSKEEIGKLFQKHTKAYMGSYVEQSKGSENWWIHVSHFRYFFYVYSYASGLLISKSLQAEVKKDPKFIKKVKEFLSTGLSESPKNIFLNLGIDISKKAFWDAGLEEIDTTLNETRRLAKKLGKI